MKNLDAVTNVDTNKDEGNFMLKIVALRQLPPATRFKTENVVNLFELGANLLKVISPTDEDQTINLNISFEEWKGIFEYINIDYSGYNQPTHTTIKVVITDKVLIVSFGADQVTYEISDGSPSNVG